MHMKRILLALVVMGAALTAAAQAPQRLTLNFVNTEIDASSSIRASRAPSLSTSSSR
jgi:hypothetical protein